MLQVVVTVAEYEDFVIYCYFRPLFGQNGGNKVPFLPLSSISRADLGDIQRRVEVALWKLIGKASFGISPAVSRVSRVRC